MKFSITLTVRSLKRYPIAFRTSRVCKSVSYSVCVPSVAAASSSSISKAAFAASVVDCARRVNAFRRTSVSIAPPLLLQPGDDFRFHRRVHEFADSAIDDQIVVARIANETVDRQAFSDVLCHIRRNISVGQGVEDICLAGCIEVSDIGQHLEIEAVEAVLRCGKLASDLLNTTRGRSVAVTCLSESSSWRGRMHLFLRLSGLLGQSLRFKPSKILSRIPLHPLLPPVLALPTPHHPI